MENQNEVTEYKVPLKEILKGKDGELIVLQDYAQTEEILKGISKKHSELLITSENFEIGKAARKEIRDFRYAIQNIQKHNTSIINEAKKIDKARHDKLIEIILPVEEKLDSQIKEIEQENERLKAEAEEKERLRVAAIRGRLSDYEFELEKLITFGKNEEDLEKFSSIINEIATNTDSFEEFQGDAEIILSNFNSSRYLIEQRIYDAKKQEEERIALQKQKAEQEKKEKDIAEREAKLKAFEESQKAEQEAKLNPIHSDIFAIVQESENTIDDKEVVLERHEISDIGFEDFVPAFDNNQIEAEEPKVTKFCDEFKVGYELCEESKLCINKLDNVLRSVSSHVNVMVNKKSADRIALTLESMRVMLNSLEKDFNCEG